jgi:hypothetical protein
MRTGTADRAQQHTLLELALETAARLDRDGEREACADKPGVGAVVLVRLGEPIPADGRVLDGASDVDSSGLTGEPVPRCVGDGVHASIVTGRTRLGWGWSVLWVTEITEHHPQAGKPYCAVVLDTYSRRVVGWSIDSSPTAALVNQRPGHGDRLPPATDRTIIHSDQGASHFLPFSDGRCATIAPVNGPVSNQWGSCDTRWAWPSSTRAPAATASA